jgi:HPt (histidine-containing phosphotransfer) domain-containing protein
VTAEKTSLVDWSQLLMLRTLQGPGEPDIVSDLISSFLVDADARMAHLHEGVSTGDLKIVAHEAHTLKGSAALLGAEPLRREAEALETAARSGSVPDLDDLVRRLDEAIHEAKDALAHGPPAG